MCVKTRFYLASTFQYCVDDVARIIHSLVHGIELRANRSILTTMAFRRLLSTGVASRALMAPRLATPAVRRTFSTGKKDGALQPVYNMVMKNNSAYVFSIVIVAAVAGVVFNETVDAVWETSNRGKLYHHVDWDRFKEEDDDEDDEDDDE